MGDNNQVMEKSRAAAMKFVEHVDATPQIEANAFLKNVGRSMAELYSVALSLPAVEPETTDVDDAPFQTDKLDELRRSLQRRLGALDIYWQIFDSTQKEEPVQGRLSGDMSEIYFDLKQSLARGKSGHPNSDVLFDWRLDFQHHWGRHLLGALAAIHHHYFE